MKVINPGGTIGIIGSGQLGMMLTIKARQMGYKVILLTEVDNSPAVKYANATYNILDEFIANADIITVESENTDIEVLNYCNKLLKPSFKAVNIASNRFYEKELFNQLQIPTTEYKLIKSKDDIASVPNTIFPAILKTTRFGYDGKGQQAVNSIVELQRHFSTLQQECILEKKVAFTKEASVIIAINNNNQSIFPVTQNKHQNGILLSSQVPADIDHSIQQKMIEYTTRVAKELQYYGILTIEFFITENQVLANEMAPRVHNSGHHTIESCNISQFEQHIRAICNLPLAKVNCYTPTIMLNILSNNYNQLNWQKILEHEDARLHLYGKTPNKPNRKMGHITLSNSDLISLTNQAKAITYML